MEINEAMVEQSAQTVPVGTDEQLTETKDASTSIDSIMQEGNTATEEGPKEEGQHEPGWFQKRWNKERSKLADEIRAEVRSEYEQQFAPMRERLIEMDARELVASGKVKDLETAKELVRYRQGSPAQAEQPKEVDRPRNPKGQFTSNESPASARATWAREQAEKVRAKTGLDVVAEFNNNPEIQQKVISGEMDFYDVADAMAQRNGGKQQSKGKPPAPMRSPNGATGGEKTPIANMTKAQFAKMDKMISEGVRFDIK